ncbi:YoaK family protein [Streptomyces sp. NPDC048507]|uniref:YoaK family protein n=1 Tax=Streptomyces sp. NPDC048507 TaxID=3365560 RepID=UPI00371EC928
MDVNTRRRGAGALRPTLAGLLLALTAVTGLIEAVSLLALGPVFTAMQTGNVLFLAFGAAHEGGLPTLPAAVSLAAFVLGAVCGARLEAAAELRGWRWMCVGLYAETALIVAAAVSGWGVAPRFGGPGAPHLLEAALLSVAMGIRNVTSMRVDLPGVPTTLVTRSMTGLVAGSVLGRDSAFGYGSGAAGWARRALAVLAMFTGGLAGALLVRAGWTVGELLLPAAVVVAAVTVVHRALLPRLHSR